MSESPLVETTSSVRTSTLDQTADREPAHQRAAVPGLHHPHPHGAGRSPRGQLSFSGQRGINSNISVDGADFNQPFFGGIRGGERSNNAFTIPQEAIQEFQVAAAGYSAEFGRSTGGLVNAITKSGTNELPRLRLLPEPQQGLGGEQRLRPEGGAHPAAVRRLHRRPPAEGQGLLLRRHREAALHEHAGRCCSTGWPGSRPPPATQEAFDYYKSLETPFEATNDAWTALARLDYQFNSANRLSVRYSHSDNNALNANATGNALDPNTISALSNNGTEKDNTNIVIGQFTSSLRSNLLLEVRGAVGARGAAAPGQRGGAERDQRHRQLRDGQLPAHDAVRQALPGAR